MARQNRFRIFGPDFRFEPRDLWVGVYWRENQVELRPGLQIYICIVPAIVIRLSIAWGKTPDLEEE